MFSPEVRAAIPLLVEVGHVTGMQVDCGSSAGDGEINVFVMGIGLVSAGAADSVDVFVDAVEPGRVFVSTVEAIGGA